jgi:hypothetical protein
VEEEEAAQMDRLEMEMVVQVVVAEVADGDFITVQGVQEIPHQQPLVKATQVVQERVAAPVAAVVEALVQSVETPFQIQASGDLESNHLYQVLQLIMQVELVVAVTEFLQVVLVAVAQVESPMALLVLPEL